MILVIIFYQKGLLMKPYESTFAFIKDAILIICITILSVTSIFKINDILLPHPTFNALVTVDQKTEPERYKEQSSHLENKRQEQQYKSFYFFACIGIFLLLLSIFIIKNVLFLSLSSLLSGTICIIFSLSQAQSKNIELMFLLSALFVMIFAGFRLKDK